MHEDIALRSESGTPKNVVTMLKKELNIAIHTVRFLVLLSVYVTVPLILGLTSQCAWLYVM